jgi:hypothetical protein
MFYIKKRITQRFLFSKQVSKEHTLLKTNMCNYVPIKHKEMSFVSNGGKFKLYTVLNGLLFPTPIQPRIFILFFPIKSSHLRDLVLYACVRRDVTVAVTQLVTQPVIIFLIPANQWRPTWKVSCPRSGNRCRFFSRA